MNNRLIGQINTYKEEHELFVSNLKGTSAACVFVFIAHAPVLLLLLKLVQYNRRPRILRDYIFLVVPLLLNMTILVDQCYFTLPLLILSELYILRSYKNNLTTNLYNNTNIYINDIPTVSTLSIQSNNTQKCTCNIDKSLNNENRNQLSFISIFKGFVVLITCLSILAVDFRIFPRRFAKTETFGISLMDIGVGLFIVSSAITSKYARGIVIIDTYQSKSLKYKILSTISIKYIIVLLLGIGRMIVIKTLNYQEKPSEYGIHWNFFVTLFCIWIICDIIHRCISKIWIVILSIVTLLLYQFILLYTNLSIYIFIANRTNFISCNREGIFSLISYIPMYLLVELFSYYYIFRPLNNSNNNSNSINNNDLPIESSDDINPDCTIFGIKSNHLCNNILKSLCYYCISSWILWIISSTIQQTSRRLTNLTYILLVIAYSLSMLLLALLADIIGGIDIRIVTIEYLNKYQLEVFLLANVLTGLINLSIKTIYTSHFISMIIMLIYTFVIVMFAWIINSIREHQKI